MLASASKSAVVALTLASCSVLTSANVGAGIIKALNVYGGALYPEFSPTNFNYELDLDDEGVLQKHKDFGVLSNNLALSPAGGHSPAVILAPHLSLDEYGEQQQEQPRLFIDSREVPRKPQHAEHPHVAISRKELLAASFHLEDGRHAYALIVLEVHLPRVGNTDLEEDGGLQNLRYIIRVHNTVSRIEEANQRRLLAKPAPHGWGTPVATPPVAVPEGLAEVMRGSDTIAIKLTDGICFRTTGPFATKPLVSASAQALGLYQGDSQHILCFGDSVDKAADEEHKKFKFEAKRLGTNLPDSNLGKFGFGPGARVALRPEIATDAVWPLQEGVQSLGVLIPESSSFRVIGLRAHTEEGKQIDLPLVMTRTRKDWPLDVQFVDSSIGKCHPRPGPDNVLLFVCRSDEDITAETPTQFIAFCPDCREQDSGAKRRLMMKVESEGGGAAGGRQTSATLQVASSQNSGGIEKAWASWTTEVPAHGLQRQWAITVQPARSGNDRADAPGGSALEAPQVFQVLFVSASTTLAFESVTLTSDEKEKLVAAGIAMSQAAFIIATLLGAISTATFVLGLPNRLLAVLPSLSATALAVQFLALAGNLPTAPEPLRALAGPLAWLAPGTAKSTLLGSLGVFAIVLLVHGLAVCKFIIYNGRGSANSLPHGFSFGGWELRALGILAFPLVASSATYVVPFLVPSQRYTFWVFVSTPAACILAGMAGLVIFTWRRVSKAIHDDEVLLMTLPAPVGSNKDDGYPVFTDHFCDQLRSIPSDAGQSTLLADWLATPSWCHKPEVASIHLVEHRGPRLFKPTMFHWCSEYHSGPWRAHQPRQQVEDEASNDPSVVKLPSDYTLFKLGIKQAPSATNAEAVYREVNAEFEAARGNDRGSIATSTTALWGNTTTSELVMQHPIGIKTKFAYQGSQMAGGTVAGVRCLSWINCAIPAATLVKLESHLQGEVTLRTQVGQMSGPVSGGRFAACFDWGVVWPWNWPADVALKVMLGIWVTMLPFAEELSSTTASALNGITIGLTVTCALATFVFRPYVHIFDVLAAACARTAVALTVVACLMLDNSANPSFAGAWGSFVPAMLAVAVLTLVPLCILLVATVILTMSMMRDTTCRGCSQGNQAAEELLEKFWKERRQTDGDLYEHVDLGKHMIDVVFQDMHPAPRLPALVRSPVEHLRLQPSPGRRGTCTQLPPAGKPWLSLVPSLLFPLASNRTSNNRNSTMNPSRSAGPIAALCEAPDDGRLLFQERANNGGLEWREVLHSFVDSIDEDCAKEAERLIQAYEFPLEGAGAERSLVIIELIPTDVSTGLMSLIR